MKLENLSTCSPRKNSPFSVFGCLCCRPPFLHTAGGFLCPARQQVQTDTNRAAAGRVATCQTSGGGIECGRRNTKGCSSYNRVDTAPPRACNPRGGFSVLCAGGSVCGRAGGNGGSTGRDGEEVRKPRPASSFTRRAACLHSAPP